MSQVVIENPIINSPFDEPAQHFRFADEGITNEMVDGRRISSYFVPIDRPKKKRGAAQQALFGTEWTQDLIEQNKFVNGIRRRVALWRKGGYFCSHNTGAEGEVPLHLEAGETKRWLRRNTTHLVHAVTPRMPAEIVFRLTNFSSV